jgi:uncharacterized membrane protein
MSGRSVGSTTSALRRLSIAAVVGVVVGVLVSLFVTVDLAVLCGWDAAAITFLVTVWPAIMRADGAATQALATRQDLSHDTARPLLLVASSASVIAVVLAMSRGRQESGADRWTLVTIAAVTVVLSWTLVNTVFLLRYAHLYYSSPRGGVDFAGMDAADRPDYRDFAYLAFTIGMCYQVSDTSLRDRRIRRTVMVHALMSYVFGVVIIATGVNIVAGLG